MEYSAAELNRMLVYLVLYLVSQLLPVQSGIPVVRNTVPLPQVLSPTPLLQVQGKSDTATPAALVMPSDALSVPFKRIVDGDTLQIEYAGKSKSVRLIGINSPESVDPRRPVQCFGKEASNYAKSLITSPSIYITQDPTQGDRDKYDRLLRYVWLADGTNLNYQMIANGYAFEYTYNLPYLYQKQFQTAQKKAQRELSGLWAKTACDGVLKDGN